MELLERLESSISARAMKALDTLGSLAESGGDGLYLVGGMVRDLLMGAQLHTADLDLMVLGNAPAFAYKAASRLAGKCEIHKQFGTATIFIPGDEELRIDLASARTETYRRPGALPSVSQADSVEQDLYRRDFTINAIAVSLLPGGRGTVIDPFRGRDDIENQLLRVIHSGSFLDDPTRILRGIRFKARFDFEFEHETMSLLGGALENEYINTVSGARIRKEIRTSLEEACRAAIINELSRLGIDGMLAPGLDFHTRFIEPRDLVSESAARLSGAGAELALRLWVAYLLAATEGADGETLEYLARRLMLSKKDAAPLLNPLSHSRQIRERILDPELSAAVFAEIAAPAEDEVLVLLHAADSDGILKERIEEYVSSSRETRLEISGSDLLGMGHEPSAMIGEVLREVRRAKIEGKVKNRRQELALARKLLNAWD